MPLLEPIYQKYKDQGFEIIGIDVRGDDGRAKQFVDENNLTYAMLSGDIKIPAQAYGIVYTPTSFIISRDGTVLERDSGYNESNIGELDKKIESLLN